MRMDFPPLPKRTRSPFEVIAPNLGLYLGRSFLEVPDRGFSDCNNIRIRNRKVTNELVGYKKLFATSLGNQVLLVDLHRASTGVNTTIFGTKTDLFRYDEGTNLPVYITPIYATGTVAVTNGDAVIVGTGTLWLANVKAGDKISVGSASQSAVSATWYTVQTVTDNTHITLTTTYGQATLGGQSYTARKLFTANDSDIWDTDIFPDAPLGAVSALPAGDHWYGTNGKEVVVWDGSAARAVVISTISTGLGFACKTLCYYKNMMLYGGITEGASFRPGNFKNSAISIPENVTTLEANEFSMAQSVDFLIALRRLGDYVVGYCDASINVAQFVESPFYFAIRTAAPRIGTFSPRTIVNFGDFHEFIAKDQAYRFDGVRLVPYANQVFDDVLRRVDRNRSAKALAILSEQEQEVYWMLPLVTDGTTTTKSVETAWTEHYAESVGSAPQPFTKRDLPATAAGYFKSSPNSRWSDFTGITFDQLNQPFVTSYFSAGFPVVLFGDENGYLYTLNIQTGKDTTPEMRSFFTSPTRPLADGNSRGIVRRVEPYLEKRTPVVTLDIEINTSERMPGDLTPEDGSVLSDHSGDRFTPARNPGRYASVTFSTDLASENWKLEGYRVMAETLGER